MQAIVQDRYGDVDVLELREIDRPVPGDGEVLVRVRAAGVDAGVWHVLTGTPYGIRLVFGLRRPRHPVRGREVAGEVEAVGGTSDGPNGLEPGTAVMGICEGSFAEYACVSTRKLVPKPAGLTFEQAAVLPVSASTALQAVRDKGKVQAGQTVLVVGAGGGVGACAVQIAKALGGRVTGVCSTGKVDLVRSLGADDTIDYTRSEFTDGERRWDVVLDIAGARPVSVLRRAVTPDGTLVIVGGEGRGRILGPARRSLWVGLLSPFVGQKLTSLVARERRDDLVDVAAMVDEGTLAPVVARSFPLREAPAAVALQAEGHTAGKLVVTM
jgi:NADPH:quinone reductase-like Zn-dependent oxidoreductase